MLKLKMLLPTLFVSAGASAKVLELSTPAEADSAQVFRQIEKIESLLPIKMKQAFSKPITVRFQNLKAHGSSSQRGIILNLSLLNDLVKNQDRASLFNRTLLHEIAHSYDQKALLNAETKAMRDYCKQPSETKDPQCLFWREVATTVSTNPHYLGKAGWLSNLNSTSILREENNFKYRSPDEYELTNPSEHFAVNFEYFMTDADYKCRRPTLFQFLRNHFDHDPFPLTRCKDTLVFADPRDDERAFHKIDLDRLYKIDYLFASRGTATMSKWGHAMLRLVMCAPGKPLDDSCYKETGHHLVISYRAFIDTPMLNSWDGLTGKYPSRAFFSSLISVTKEYNQQELRDLQAIPLNLTREEMVSVVQRAIETHWSYSGRYYFKSNNCATEVFNLLRSALNRSELFEYNPLHPLQLKDVVERSSLADKRYLSLLSKPADAGSAGLFFGSYITRYRNSLKVLGTSIDVEAYKALSFAERQALVLPAVKESIQGVAAQLILEETVYNYKRGLIIQRTAKKLSEETTDSSKKYADDLQRLRNATGIFSAPYMLLIANSDSYGLPSLSEQERISQKLREQRKLLADFPKQSEALFVASPEEEAELKRTYENIVALNQKFIQARNLKRK